MRARLDSVGLRIALWVLRCALGTTRPMPRQEKR